MLRFIVLNMTTDMNKHAIKSHSTLQGWNHETEHCDITRQRCDHGDVIAKHSINYI